MAPVPEPDNCTNVFAVPVQPRLYIDIVILETHGGILLYVTDDPLEKVLRTTVGVKLEAATVVAASGAEFPPTAPKFGVTRVDII